MYHPIERRVAKLLFAPLPQQPVGSSWPQVAHSANVSTELPRTTFSVLFFFCHFILHRHPSLSLSFCFLVVRVFAFDEQQNKFLLLAQSHYLKRCVLTVNHVTDFLESGRPLVILFAGDTAGKISCWDVTALLLNHIKEHCDLTSEEGELVTKVSRSEFMKGIEVAKLTAQDEKPGNKPSEKRLCEEDVSSITCETAPESAPSCHAQENLTTVYSNKVKCLKSGAVDCGADCNVSNVEINTEAQRTERTENEFQLHSEERILRKAADGEEHTAVACETPVQSSVNENHDNETFSTLCEKQSNFSCLPLVRIFLDPPTHVFQAHQSGVNAVSLTKTQGKTTQLLFSEWIPLKLLICR